MDEFLERDFLERDVMLAAMFFVYCTERKPELLMKAAIMLDEVTTKYRNCPLVDKKELTDDILDLAAEYGIQTTD